VSIRWLTLLLDFPAGKFDDCVTFWRQVTGYGLSAARGAADEFATLLPPSGDAYLRVQRVADGTGGSHLDLHVDTETESLAAATERARILGATLRHQEAGLVVAESPAGLPFCLTGWDGERAVPPPLAGARGGASRVDTLCVDVPRAAFERECAFWAELTGWAVRPLPYPEYVMLRPPAGSELAARVILQRLGDSDRGGRARAHVDFGSTDPEALARHVGLGAHVVHALEHWTVLADPAGRVYCLVNRG
jgi:Glyoxalase-like domain